MDIATVQDKCELFTAFDGPRRAGPVMAHKTLDSPADLVPRVLLSETTRAVAQWRFCLHSRPG
jgi:hypothetical protein